MAKKIAEKAVESASAVKRVEIKHLRSMKDEAGKDVSVVDRTEVLLVDVAIEDAEAQLVTAEARVTELKADDDKEYKILRYEEMIPYLVEAIKEQQKQINKLEEKLNG